jgi:hypothetical protein
LSPYDGGELERLLALSRDPTASTTDRGRALESLVADLFGAIPGVRCPIRDRLDVFGAQEIDVAAANSEAPDGLTGFPRIFLIECKNWASPVGSLEVAWFDTKLRMRGLSFGVLVAMNGITGQPHALTAAHSIVAAALQEGRELVVVVEGDIRELASPAALVQLLQDRRLELYVTRGLPATPRSPSS